MEVFLFTITSLKPFKVPVYHSHHMQVCVQSNVTLLILLTLYTDGHLTYLISFAQSFIHYHSIATKLGVNLSKQKENGNFVFVDCLTGLVMTGGDLSKGSNLSLSQDAKKQDITCTKKDVPSSNSSILFSLSR